jgi:hypothetical protein
MESLKKHGDPLEDPSRKSAAGPESEEIRHDPARGIEEVASNQPGSKGWREEDEQPIVRSADQTPNPNQPDDDATTPADADLGRRRSNM